MEFIQALWKYTLTAAPFLMFGLFISGLIHVFVSTERIKKSLGGKGIFGVIKASLFGIPLPLCSCAVVPTAVTLKKNGASNSATSSFLISTPESGVDSIAMTYGMMDLPMTIIRPVAAFFSAFVAGVLQIIFNSEDVAPVENEKEAKSTGCCAKKSCDSEEVKESFGSKMNKVFKFSFFELIDDFAFWLTLGIVAGAFIDFIVPPNFFESLSGWSGRLIILGIGIPLYICASATTPIAASLVMKGMSPGTSLLILLVGPATNISNLLVIAQYIGKKGVILNIIAIAGVALGMSFLVDYLYAMFAWPLNFNIHAHAHEGSSWLELALTVSFIILLGKSLVMKELPKLIKMITSKKSSKSSGCCG
ncbi:MAG: SO_0444 family Cu/Zn efflux transporter [Bacteriovoracaceae bacterium]|nr:SO_0444 family Cu/Zn efflux transporter [Bacteriovoracaceae bacterium]OIQ19170.1 MAG: hypothetical protein BM556_07745 [Bacteriovorax sp. MedPE-SWde]